MACAYILYQPDCELLGHPYEMDGSILLELQEPLTAHEREFLRSEFTKICCKDCNRCDGGDRDNPLSLWIVTETELRKDLHRMVRLRTEYRVRRWPDEAMRLREEVQALVQEVLLIRNCDNAGSTPTAKTNGGEGNGKKARARQSRKRKRKADPKTVKKQEEQKARHEMEQAIAEDWSKGEWTDYQDYVTCKNENLPAGWPNLDRHAVTRAIENVRRRARYRKK